MYLFGTLRVWWNIIIGYVWLKQKYDNGFYFQDSACSCLGGIRSILWTGHSQRTKTFHLPCWIVCKYTRLLDLFQTPQKGILCSSLSLSFVLCVFLYTNIIIFAKYLWCGSAGNTVGHLPLSNQIWNMSGQGSHYDWTRCLTTFHQHILTSSFEVIVRPYNLVRCIVERLKMQLIWSPMQLL